MLVGAFARAIASRSQPPRPHLATDAVSVGLQVKVQTVPGFAKGLTNASASAAPFAGLQVKVQTVPGFAKGLTDGMPKFIATEGVGGLFKGLTPLWGRQIPYTMMKFGAFENVVQALYKVSGGVGGAGAVCQVHA